MNTYNKHRYSPDLSGRADNRQETCECHSFPLCTAGFRQQMGRYTNDIECEMDSQRLFCLDDAGFRADNRRQIDGDHSLPLNTFGIRQQRNNPFPLKALDRSTISPKGLKYHGLRPPKALDRGTNGHNATKCSVNTADKGSQLPMMTNSKAVSWLRYGRISVDFSQRAGLRYMCAVTMQRLAGWLRDFLRAVIWGLDDGGVCVFFGRGGVYTTSSPYNFFSRTRL